MPGQETSNSSPTLFAPHPYIATVVVGLEKSFQSGEEQVVNIDVLVISLQVVIGYDLKEARQPRGLSTEIQEHEHAGVGHGARSPSVQRERSLDSGKKAFADQ